LQIFEPSLLHLAGRVLSPWFRAKESAEDLVQATFLDAVRGLAHFHGDTPETFGYWLRRILCRRADKLRGRYDRAEMRNITREISFECGLSASFAFCLADSTVPPDEAAVRRENALRLHLALAQLPVRYRHIIRLRDEDCLCFREIGRRLDRSPAAARMLHTRAIGRLMSEWKNVQMGGGKACFVRIFIHDASSFRATSPATSVSRKSRPWKRNVSLR
jgi:RNA polymerase sigma-70 factor (subfamily 1)